MDLQSRFAKKRSSTPRRRTVWVMKPDESRCQNQDDKGLQISALLLRLTICNVLCSTFSSASHEARGKSPSYLGWRQPQLFQFFCLPFSTSNILCNLCSSAAPFFSPILAFVSRVEPSTAGCASLANPSLSRSSSFVLSLHCKTLASLLIYFFSLQSRTLSFPCLLLCSVVLKHD